MATAQGQAAAAAAAGPAGVHALAQAHGDHAQAQGDLQGAQQDAAAAQRQADAAAEEVRRAERAGQQANEHADHAATRASATFEQIAGQAAPPVCYPTPAVPVSMRGASPAIAGQGLTVAAGATIPLAQLVAAAATPGQVRAAQIVQQQDQAQLAQRQRAEEQAKANNPGFWGNFKDALGGEVAGLVGWSPFGNTSSKAYQDGDKVGNILGYVDPATIVEHGAERFAVKEGAHELEQQGGREATHTIVEGSSAYRSQAGADTRLLTNRTEAYLHTTKPLGTETHHLVPKGAYSTRSEASRQNLYKAQAKLEQYGINPDDGPNGAFLSKANHRSVHTDKYFESLNRELVDARSGADVERILGRVRKQLTSPDGNFPH